jgi:hypothetical protein
MRTEEAVAPAAPGAAPSRQPPRLWPLLVVLAVQAALIGAIYLLAVRYAPPPAVIPLDALALPGVGATIGVHLETQGSPIVAPRVAGTRVEFFPATAAGESRETDRVGIVNDAGIASVTVAAPAEAGIYTYRARLAPSEGSSFAGEEEVLLEVAPADRPLIFVVVPETLSPDLLPGATAALRDLGRERSTVYVRTNRLSASRLRAWLEENDFPVGPLLTVAARDGGRSLRAELARLDLSRRAKSGLWAVTRSSAQAADFAAAGVRVVLLGAAGGLEVDGRTVFALSSWDEVRKKVAGP